MSLNRLAIRPPTTAFLCPSTLSSAEPSSSRKRTLSTSSSLSCWSSQTVCCKLRSLAWASSSCASSCATRFRKASHSDNNAELESPPTSESTLQSVPPEEPPKATIAAEAAAAMAPALMAPPQLSYSVAPVPALAPTPSTAVCRTVRNTASNCGSQGMREMSKAKAPVTSRSRNNGSNADAAASTARGSCPPDAKAWARAASKVATK
mmetsp:Transcript_78079/g.226553  ORF Transcript_78079/g.226553 Transcript_78079/m.226553 type:complete len:207 (-) Transcript_78079:26-646(-)